ncbi:MAG: insulinase family protein [Oscillospiraceae bacterium]
MIERKEIAKGIFLSKLDGNYKKTALSVFLRMDTTRENVTAGALLPQLLERGTRKYRDTVELRRYLNKLYGAGLSATPMKFGSTRITEININGVAGAFVGEPVDELRAKLLLETLFEPNASDAAFDAEWTGVEKNKLGEYIKSSINDKRTYCLEMLEAEYCKNDVRGLPDSGLLSDIDAITPESIYDYYRSLISQSQVEIVCAGKLDGDMQSDFFNEFERVNRAPKELAAQAPIAKRKPVVVSRQMDVVQDKLAMLFNCGFYLCEREQAVMRVANAILGGAPTSRLFMNVREKQSLCYYCSSRIGNNTGGTLTIDVGTEKADALRARDAIEREFEVLRENGVGKKELAETKLLFKNMLTGVRDTANSYISNYYVALLKNGYPKTPEAELAELMTVTSDEICELLGKYELNTVCNIAGEN